MECFSVRKLQCLGIILMLLTSCISESDAQCNPTPGGVKRFGTKCNFRCQCLKNEQCDAETGICTSGCHFNWTGPGCQYSNIALNEESRHSDNVSPTPKYSYLANDRDVNTCSFTNYASVPKTYAPWWALWFDSDVTFSEMVFMTLENNLRYFPGFHVSVQQDVSRYDHEEKKYHSGEICYQHDKSTPGQRTVYVKCPKEVVGNQLRLELANSSTQLVICDFRVYGECKDRTWGDTCEQDCGLCNDLAKCDANNGYCPSGCDLGYKSTPTCNEECDNGTYGKNCFNQCNRDCRNNVCHKGNGTCSDGCNPGYTGNKCEHRCADGYYGGKCSQRCGDNCIKVGKAFTCDNVNGSCLQGCKAGWKGEDCQTICDFGKWGEGCRNECGKCSDGSCSRFNGTCSGGCLPGYKYTEMCNQECDNGTFGTNCKQNCSDNCVQQRICKKTDGECDGCRAGWQGKLCNTKCSDGSFGDNCSEKCGACAEDGTCNVFTGKCTTGCSPGFELTDLCTKACSDGKYGINCNYTCGMCQTLSGCSKQTGVCNEGCLEGYIGDMCVEEDPPAEPFPVAGVVGGVSAAIVVGGAVVIVLFILRKRHQSKEKRKTNSNNDKIFSQAALVDEVPKHKKEISKRENVYLNTSELERQKFQKSLDGNDQSGQSTSTQEESNVYYNDTLSTHPTTEHEVVVSELQTYVKTGLAQKDYFVKQFQKIPYGMQYSSTVATKPENAGKNKYKAMYAYDHSRVILDIIPGKEESDYINATNIKGYSGENTYIAAQGPNTSSLEDFWRMIWEQKIRTIVMATNLIEEGKAKCIQYWPEEGQSIKMGKLIVYLESEDIFTEFTVRHLKVSQEDRPERRRNVTQFHFQAWPDKSVPRCTSSLLHFWYQVRKHNGKKTSPWLVHCSAGVGRTGTFIALDILYDQGKNKGSIDVYQCVRDLREQRVNMVQTKDQYKFLHSIMVVALVLPWKPIHIDKSARVYAELSEIDQTTGKTQILIQYESLNEGTDVGNGPKNEDDIYTSAKKTENRSKNRYDNILAPNEFRPFLYTQVTGCTDYINAVYIPGYRHKQAYIITQTPLKTTAVDCCRLIIEDKVQVIVTFADHKDEEVREYLPETGVEKIGPFTITFVSEEDMNHFMLRKYEIKFQAEKHVITELIFKHWLPSRVTPSDPTEMLCFLQELEQFQRQNESTPVLLQCLNGAERSGLVVVLMNILERVRFDNEVSITQVIRQLKIRRQQIIPNLEQFKFCHDVLLSHIQSNSTYANM